jgi:hypothetical protein
MPKSKVRKQKLFKACPDRKFSIKAAKRYISRNMRRFLINYRRDESYQTSMTNAYHTLKGGN